MLGWFATGRICSGGWVGGCGLLGDVGGDGSVHHIGRDVDEERLTTGGRAVFLEQAEEHTGDIDLVGLFRVALAGHRLAHGGAVDDERAPRRPAEAAAGVDAHQAGTASISTATGAALKSAFAPSLVNSKGCLCKLREQHS